MANERADETSRDGRKQDDGDGRRVLSRLMDGQEARTESASLPSGMRAEMEQSMDVDLADVSLTKNDPAVDRKGARAQTVGSKVSFGVGQFQPGTAGGQKLIRHELAHVAQNKNKDQATVEAGRDDGRGRRGRGRGTDGPEQARQGSQADREREADAVARGDHAGPVEQAGAPEAAQLDIKQDLRKAMEGWGTDTNAIFNRLSSATAVELQAVLGDAALLDELKSELSRGDMLRLLDMVQAPPAQKLRMAMQGWGVDSSYILRTLSACTAPQLQTVLADAALMADLNKDLGKDEMKRVLNLLNAPAQQKLDLAMQGWGTDEDYIFATLAGATPAERTAIANDAAMMARLKSELSRELFLRAVAELGQAIPIKDRLNMAMDGWGVERNYLFQQLQGATAAEKTSILNDAAMMERLRGKLSREDYNALLTGLNAPVADRLRWAINGWGADTRYIYDTIAVASNADKVAVLNDANLMKDLKGKLSREETNRLMEDLQAPLETKINFALEGWGVDKEFINRALVRATPAERTALQANNALMTRLRAKLSDEELRAAFGATPSIEAFRLINAGNHVAAFMLVTHDPATVKANLDQLDGLSSSVALIRRMPRGQACPNDIRQGLNNLILNDDSVDRIKAAFEVRWAVGLDTELGGTPPVNPSWTPDYLRRVHQAMLSMPDSQANAGRIRRIILEGGSTGGSWDGSNFRTGDGVLGVGTQPYGDNTAPAGSPGAVRNVDWLSAVVRHEVGHAVDDMLGGRTNALKVGVAKWQWGTSIDQWMDGMNAWQINSPQPGLPASVPAEDQEAIKAHIATYLRGAGTAALDAGLPAGHAIKKWMPAQVTIIQAALGCAGLGKGFWQSPNRIWGNGARRYAMNFYYHEFQSYDESVQSHRLRDYMLFSHAEFFAELYTVYYEDGVQNPGTRVTVGEWKAWMDRNVHGAGFSPEKVAANGTPSPSSGAHGGAR